MIEMLLLFRAMKETGIGLPEVGSSARALGVRPGLDVPSIKSDDLVLPSQGGMSVSPDEPGNLPYFRRPPLFQGVGRDPVWCIEESELGPDLVYRPDPSQIGHGFVEPAHSMTLDAFQRALALTQSHWRKVTSSPHRGSDSDAD
jgi:hypothetical protein